ncbi:hypothetical protein VK792_10980 [Mesobacterium sp. TK19101]|uniref:Tautomerase n=1 Tax=Mesobacterium hydrothermale TaxID=3111907 RepID=A0ABU6HH74_9RHOB|nr:hypothetical protein [Mesobacterium sp. TK19101]MEC3861809.1 hypothetical protein [Mesobacterium sp. TK19101]
MPVIRIFYDETLDPIMRAGRTEIQDKLEAMMREVLAADPAKCQVVMSAVMHATPKPVYVDLQFRANDHRTRAVVSEAMDRTAAAILAVTGTGIRISAFDIDQATLHALDLGSGEAS